MYKSLTAFWMRVPKNPQNKFGRSEVVSKPAAKHWKMGLKRGFTRAKPKIHAFMCPMPTFKIKILREISRFS